MAETPETEVGLIESYNRSIEHTSGCCIHDKRAGARAHVKVILAVSNYLEVLFNPTGLANRLHDLSLKRAISQIKRRGRAHAEVAGGIWLQGYLKLLVDLAHRRG